MDEEYRKLKNMLYQLNRELSDMKYLLDEMNITYAKMEIKQKNALDIKDNIIGKLPRLLLSDQHFPTNADRAQFASKYLNIEISYPEKKSKKDIIGRIVVEIEGLNEKELLKLNDILNLTTDKMSKKKESSFFVQWEKAISELNIRR
jgi:hypothetical protein